jgi:multiple sugar transport system substrate-binding protein
MRRTALLMTVLLAAACGHGADDPTAAGQPSPTQAGSSAALSGSLRIQAAGGEGELKALQEVVAAFEAANPRLTVDFTGVAEQGDHLAKLTAGFAAGNAPDAFLLNYRRVGAFLERQVVDPVRTSGVDVADFYKAPVAAFSRGGTLQCLPQNASSSVVYVNETLFAKAGVPLPSADWTADDLLKTAGALAAKGVESIAFEPGTRTVAPFVWSAGGEYVDSTDRPTRITLGSPEARSALELLTQLQRSGFDARQRAAEDPQDAFGAGHVAMLVDSRRAVPGLRKAGVAFDVRPLPKGAAGSVSLLASDGWCVSKASKNLDAAHAFAAFTVGDGGGTVLAESGRSVPVSKALAQSPAFLAAHKAPETAQVFLDSIGTLRRLPNVANQNEAEGAADDLLEQYFAGKLPLAELVQEVDRATAAAYAG